MTADKIAPRDISEVLDDWQVDPPELSDNDNDHSVKGWYGVSNGEEGIIAYFFREVDACRFRLAEVNRVLNG